ncbi:MAG TPA: hypothetical protein DEB70_08410 [Planctomycetaceae bacterium]|nr:hypothetical protein [Planctomycetaceae bacterium]
MVNEQRSVSRGLMDCRCTLLIKHAQLKRLRSGMYSTLMAKLIAIGAAVMALGSVDNAHPVMLGLFLQQFLYFL